MGAEGALLAAWAALGAWLDWRYRRLPNWLTVGGLVAGALVLLIAGRTAGGAAPAAGWTGVLAGLLALLPAWLLGRMGAGDVKFFAAMGMLGGVWVLAPTLLVASLFAGLQALVFLAARRGWLPLPWLLALGGQERRGVPFGVGLAAGFVLAQALGWTAPGAMPWK